MASGGWYPITTSVVGMHLPVALAVGASAARPHVPALAGTGGLALLRSGAT
jgi:hypothetical protein